MNSEIFNSVPEWARAASHPIPAGHWERRPLRSPAEALAVLAWKSRFGTTRLPPGLFGFPDGPYTATPHNDVARPKVDTRHSSRPRAVLNHATTTGQHEQTLIPVFPGPRVIRAHRSRIRLYAHWVGTVPLPALGRDLLSPLQHPFLTQDRWIDRIWQRFQATFPEFSVTSLGVEIDIFLVVWQANVVYTSAADEDKDAVDTLSRLFVYWVKVHIRTRVFMGSMDRVHISVADADDDARFEAEDQHAVNEIYASHPTIWQYGSHRLTWNIVKDDELNLSSGRVSAMG